MATQEWLTSWLKDVYSMETAIMRVLENRIQDTKDMPQVQAKYRQHLDTTRQQAEMVKGCIERLGDNVSALKTGIANLVGVFQAVSTGPAKDELVKNCLADFATENFEIASYRALVEAANAVGDTETARVCQQILNEEMQMARWVEQQLPVMVQHFLSQQTTQRKVA
jgi:ferritin-like metal-binding protein YciE